MIHHQQITGTIDPFQLPTIDLMSPAQLPPISDLSVTTNIMIFSSFYSIYGDLEYTLTISIKVRTTSLQEAYL